MQNMQSILIIMLVIVSSIVLYKNRKLDLYSKFLFIYIMFLQPSTLLRFNIIGKEIGSYLPLTVMLIAVFLIGLLTKKISIININEYYTLLIFLIYIVLSYFWSASWEHYFYYISSMTFQIIMAIIIMHLIINNPKDNLRMLITAIVLYSLIISSLIIFDLISTIGIINTFKMIFSKDYWTHTDMYSDFWKGLWSYQKIYSGKSSIILPFLCLTITPSYLNSKYCFLEAKNLIKAAYVISFVMVLFSSTRGAIVALIVMFMGYIFQLFNNGKLKLLMFSFKINFLILLLIAPILLRLLHLNQAYFKGRDLLWQFAYDNMLIDAGRLLLGYGIGSTEYYVRSIMDVGNFHNIAIQLFFELGVCGFILFISIFIKISIDVYKKSMYRKTNSYTVIGIIGILTFMLFNLHLNVFLLWIYIAYALALLKLNKEDERRKNLQEQGQPSN